MPQVGKKGRINGLRNLKIAKLTTDTDASTVFGTAVSLGAQSKLTFTPQYKTSDLETSSGIENSRSLITHLNWSLEGGELNLDAYDVAIGGYLYQDPAAGVSKSIFAVKKGLNAGYFGIIGQPDLVEAGPADFYACLLKCQVNQINPADQGDGWAKVSMGGRSLYTLKDGALFGVATLEAVTDITFTVALADVQAAIASGT